MDVSQLSRRMNGAWSGVGVWDLDTHVALTSRGPHEGAGPALFCSSAWQVTCWMGDLFPQARSRAPSHR